jgi:hypothetical protein
MPVPVDLTKPGRIRAVRTSKTHRVYQHPFGCLEIERASDGATAFFQGDDADTLADRLKWCSAGMLHTVMDEYDHILRTEG